MRVRGIEYKLVRFFVTVISETEGFKLESLVVDEEFSKDLSKLDDLALFHYLDEVKVFLTEEFLK
jgi:hypothetical protein